MIGPERNTESEETGTVSCRTSRRQHIRIICLPNGGAADEHPGSRTRAGDLPWAGTSSGLERTHLTVDHGDFSVFPTPRMAQQTPVSDSTISSLQSGAEQAADSLTANGFDLTASLEAAIGKVTGWVEAF